MNMVRWFDGGKRWWTAAAALCVIVAIFLTLGDVRLASSQAVTFTAYRVEEAVPLDDPFASVWKEAVPVEVPLSAQNVTPPYGGGPRTLIARALNDGSRLFLLLEWRDHAADWFMGGATAFPDAAGVQFPVQEGEDVPSFCMGDPNAPVNIWQWKAAWQRDIETGFVDIPDLYPNMAADLYPFEEEAAFHPARAVGNVFAEVERQTAADNLLAGSFGTLTQASAQLVDARGSWQDSRWRVVFVRDLQVDSGYTQFPVEGRTNVAFAVWDGSQGERDGMKSVSQFLALSVSTGAPPGSQFQWKWLLTGFIAGSAVILAGFLGWQRWVRRA
jgi:complex iron-sulfur molybdoenzyme family reductase subunit gamma